MNVLRDLIQKKSPGAEHRGNEMTVKNDADCFKNAACVEENRLRLNAVSDETKRQLSLAFKRYSDAVITGDDQEAADARARFMALSKGVLPNA